jgi:hypothetical protein
MPKLLLRLLVPASLLIALAGCSTVAHKEAVSAAPGPHQLVIFFDGTHNDEVSDTNVKKLHSIVSLQHRPDIATLYVEGVGTGSDVAGMGAGLGMAARVRLAYEFLLRNYSAERGDRIYLVGFSRGAYGARILNSLLYHAGLPPKPVGMSYKEEADAVFDAVDQHKPFPPEAEPNRRHLVHLALDARGLEQTLPVPVHAMALWDSVAAMGVPDWGARTAHKLHAQRFLADIDNPYSRYGDKLCNVEHAFQALSIDDDREWIFTPLPLTRPHLIAGCTGQEDVHGLVRRLEPALGEPPAVHNGRIVEVWFAGAHSDVGGGYQDTLLSGVSLNWMLDRLRALDAHGTGIVPDGVTVREDVYGTSHDPEAGAWSPLYHAINRDIAGYALGRTPRAAGEPPRKASICVHPSVFTRRVMLPPRPNENHQLLLREPGRVCVRPMNTGDFDLQGRYGQVEREKDGLCPPDADELDIRPFDENKKGAC